MSILLTFSAISLLCFLIPAPSLSIKLTSTFYDEVCPEALLTIEGIVEAAIAEDPRMGASLLRLHFHDCFVNGCDASILLDDTPVMTGEKTAGPNNNSIRGYEVIDDIKEAVNEVCSGNVVSCADILAVAARDSIVALGGSSYEVVLGRRDSTSANINDANKQIPSPFLNLSGLIANFKSHSLSLRDLVLLSGAHTIGFARCLLFRTRVYNETSNIDPTFAGELQTVCPVSGNDDVLTGLDDSSLSFDTAYYENLMEKRGLLHSDQELFRGDGGEVDGLVQFYSENLEVFWEDFGGAMVRMGNLGVLSGGDGEVRENCRFVN